MNTKKNRIKVYNLKIETVKKDIKNIHLGVYPPKGRVRVAAPLNTSDESIRLLVISKIPWIRKQQSRFDKQERQTKRKYVSGESHYLFGKRYLLNVVNTDAKAKVEIKRNNIVDLYSPRTMGRMDKEKTFEDFYRLEIKKQIPTLVNKWQKKMNIEVSEIRIKKMKTKWGTCNQKKRRIWLNLELAKKSVHCMEYVLVHEMVHFLEKSHNNKFKALISSYMPQWEQYKKELNNSMLSYSKWK